MVSYIAHRMVPYRHVRWVCGERLASFIGDGYYLVGICRVWVPGVFDDGKGAGK